MSSKLLELRERAARYLGEMRIADGEATINQILIDLSETDELDLDIKYETLENIHSYLLIKSKLRILNADLTDLQELASSLRKNYDQKLAELKEENNPQLLRLLEIIQKHY